MSLDGTSTIFQVGGAFVPVNHSPNYFDFSTSDPAVATVSQGRVRVVGVGSATITATLQDTPVIGSVSLTGYEPPAVAPPSPTLAKADVISMLSGVYPNVPVDTWRANWAGARLRSRTTPWRVSA